MSANRQDERFTVACVAILRESERAVLVEVEADAYGLIPGEACELWFPLSQVHEIHHSAPPTLVVTPWIAKQKGLL